MRPTLCLPVDVFRKFDPEIDQEATETVIENMTPISESPRETILSRIDAVTAQLDRETGKPYLRRQVGDPDHPETWVTPNRVDFERRDRLHTISMDLKHEQIYELHGVQIRSGVNDFESIDLTEVSLNRREGTLNIPRTIIAHRFLDWLDHEGYNVRVSYSYGAYGADDNEAYQGHIPDSIPENGGFGSVLTVDDPKRIPPNGSVFLVGGEEYILGEKTDTGIRINDRGARKTYPRAQEDVDVHYVPEQIRDGVAAKTAIEVLTYIDKIDAAVGEQFDIQEKRDVWETQWQDVIRTDARFGTLF